MNKLLISILFIFIIPALFNTLHAQEIKVNSPHLALINETFIVNVTLAGSNIRGVEFDLIFNNTTINGVSAIESPLFINECTTTTFNDFPPVINNYSGKVVFQDACKQKESLRNNGTCAILHFKALSPGISSFILQYTYLIDINTFLIAHNTYSDYVTVPIGQYQNLSLDIMNVTSTINASAADVILELKTNSSNLTNEWINITTFVENYSTPALFKLEDVKYVNIEVSDGLKNNLNWTIIKIYYTEDEINTLLEETLRIYWWNGSSWVEIESGVNTIENYAWANVTHFSDYGIGGAGKADFIVDSVNISVPVIAGTNTTLTVKVVNNGNINLTLEDVNVSLFIDGVYYNSKTLNLTNKHNVTVNFSWVPGEIRKYNLTVSVNSNSLVRELTESNNEFTKFLYAHSECDLNYDKIVSSDYNDLMTAYKCFLGIKNCDTIQFRDWEKMKKEYECFTGNNN